MTLIEWSSIPEGQQRELITQWHQSDHWSDYENLASEACETLRKELASKQDVTGVQIDGGEFVLLDDSPVNKVRELILNVCTMLPESNKLEYLPSRFAGFRVEQLNLGDKQVAFLKTWKRLFKELKGWEERETEEWAKQWAEELSGKRLSLIYHKGPVHRALSGLVDDKLRQAVGKNLSPLCLEVRSAIWYGGGGAKTEHPDTVEDYDWDNVRQQIQRIIEKHTRDSKQS